MKLWKGAGKKLSAMILSIAMVLSGHTVNSGAAAGKHIHKREVDLSMVPSDALEQDGHYYKVIDESMDWYSAKLYCEEMHGHLVTITTSIEQTTIERLLEKGTKNCYWVGGIRNAGEWRWITGEEFSYQKWAFAQPDYNTSSSEEGEDALMIYKNENPKSDSSLGQWNDVYHDGTCGDEDFFGEINFGLVCEWDSYDTSEKKLQCSSSCEVILDQTEGLQITALEHSKEDLARFIGSIEWKSENPDIAAVEDSAKYIMPRTACYEYKFRGESRYIWNANGTLKIKGMSEGTTTITGTAPDGSEAACKVTVMQPQTESEGTGGGGNISLGQEKSGSTDGEAANFFPKDWSLSMAKFPVELESEEQEDGSVKVRASIGIGKSDLLGDDTKWDEFKEMVKYEGRYKRLYAIADNNNPAWYKKWARTPVSTDKFKKLPTLSAIGYLEEVYDKNKNPISVSANLAMDAEWEGSLGWQFVTPIGPMYFNLMGAGEIEGVLMPEYDFKNKRMVIGGNDDTSVVLTPLITIEGGYGVDKVATIGAKGESSVEIQLLPPTKADFKASAGVHMQLLFVIDWSQDLVSYEKELWDTTESGGKTSKKGFGQSSEGKLSEIDTSFAKMSGQWYAKDEQTKRKKSPKRKSDKAGSNIVALQEGILPSALPAQVQIGGKTVMVFQAYDKTRETLNSTVLKYSVLENGVWSEPKSVSDDGCADLFTDMKVVNDKLVLVWQKVKKKITGDVSADSESVLNDFAKNSEICFSVFDEESETFTKPVYVTNNDQCDMMPRICSDGDEVVVSWVRNDANDVTQIAGINTIYIAKWNGTFFEQEKILSQAPGTIDDYALYCDTQGVVQSVYIGQANGLTAVFDTNGQVHSGFLELMKESEDGTISGINYADGKVNCISNGILYSYDTVNHIVTPFQAGDSAFGSAVKYCSNGNKSGYIWSIYDKETGIGSIKASMVTEDGYSDTITICQEKGVIWRYFSPLLDSEGNWKIVANAENVETGYNSLIYINKKQESKLELVNVSVDENDIVDGLTGVDYFVVNTQDTTIQNLEIKGTLEDGTTITKEVPVNILPGASEYGTAYVDLKSVDAAQDIEISVYAENQTDKSDCTVKSQVGLSDIAVSADSSETEDTVTITATLTNQSSVDAKVLLHLYEDEKKMKELKSSREISLGGKGSSEVQFALDKKKISYNENNAAYLMLEAEAVDGDYNQDNNKTYVVLYQSPEENTSKPNLIGQEFFVKKMKYKVTKVNADGTGEIKLIGTKKKKSDKKFTALKIGDTVIYKKQPFKITAVGKNAFNAYKKLKSVTIGKNIKTIGEKVFYQCKKLKKITIKTVKLKSLGKKAISGIDKKAVIKIPKSKFKAYKKLFKKKTGYKKSMKIKK